MFGVVDKVIETGQDPRRFTEDLLRRLRDLVIVDAVPEATATGLIDVSEDQGERLVAQAARFGSTDLSRAADIVATGLTEMRGATAPRLLLELIVARVLLPGADHTTLGLGARLDRLERRLDIGAAPTAPSVPAAPAPAPAPTPAPVSAPAPTSDPEPDPAPEAVPEPLATTPAPVAETPEPARVPEPEAAPAAVAPSGALSLVDVRRLWPDIVEATKTRRRMAWILLTQECQVVGLEGSTLTLGFKNAGARDSFVNSGCPDIVREAALDIVGAAWTIDTIVDPSATPPAQAEAPVVVKEAADAADEAATAEPEHTPAPAAPPVAEPPSPEVRSAAREAIKETRQGNDAPRDDPMAAADADADPDDLTMDEESLGSEDLLARELGAQMIEEIPHS